MDEALNSRILFVLFVISLNLCSCSSSSSEELGYEVGFDFAIDSSNPNMVNFSNTSVGDYLYVQWDFGNGESTSKVTDKTAVRSIYYPLKGSYKVTLTVWGPLNILSDSKTLTRIITIENNDPDYQGSGETLVWSDEFNSTNINMSNWTFETGANGWGNNELQNYTNGDNAHIEDGKLVITAKKLDDNKVAGSYTSARMISLGKQEFTYGRMEIRAKLPSGTGIWPAIWMLGANINSVGWPACGEIDIMEYVGYQPDVVHATVHTTVGSGSNGDGSSVTLPTAEEEFHVYGLLWNENELVFYTDSPENVTHTYAPITKTADNWPFNQSQFFILNVAVGGDWGGAQGIDNTIFPQRMEIDYVRIYQETN